MRDGCTSSWPPSLPPHPPRRPTNQPNPPTKKHTPPTNPIIHHHHHPTPNHTHPYSNRCTSSWPSSSPRPRASAPSACTTCSSTRPRRCASLSYLLLLFFWDRLFPLLQFHLDSIHRLSLSEHVGWIQLHHSPLTQKKSSLQ